MSNRFMRIILFFDLPAVTKKDHREYTRFIKQIKKLGFIMMQESVYTKLALNPSVSNSAINDIKKNLPPEGVVSVLTITENQFASIDHLIGEIKTDIISNEDEVIKL